MDPQQHLSRSAECILFFHSILSKVIALVTTLIDMSIKTTSTNVILGVPRRSLNLNQLTLF